MLEITKNKKGEPIKAVLTLKDELSFLNSDGIAKEINSHLKEFDQLDLHINLVHIDLTGIQLIYSIKKTCDVNKKKLNVNIKMSDEIKNLVAVAGFKEIFENS